MTALAFTLLFLFFLAVLLGGLIRAANRRASIKRRISNV
jgi:hypothetical protein